MNRLMLHLTAQPNDVPTAPTFDASVVAANEEGTPSPDTRAARASERERARRAMYEAQRERLKTEWSFDVEEDSAIEPDLMTLSDNTLSSSSSSSPTSAHAPRYATDAEPRLKFEELCRACDALGVAGADAEDCASMRVPGKGYLVVPFGWRMSEVRADAVDFTDEPPALHRDLYAARPEVTCVVSARSQDSELVALSRDGLLPMCQESLRLLGQCRRADETNLGMRASRAASRHASVWMVKTRGLVACGATPELTLASLTYASRACSFQARALVAVGGDTTKLDIPSESDAIRARAALDARWDPVDAARLMFERAVEQSRAAEVTAVANALTAKRGVRPKL